MAGGQKRRAERAEAIGSLAERILAYPDGTFVPSPPPQLLQTLTDEDITVAADAVEAVVAKQQPRPSGRAQFRLLAWTVADARGAVRALDMAAAEAIGKRLDRQAQRVRRAMAAESASACVARLELSGGMADPAILQQGMAAIDAQERARLESLRAEVYVGFHELEALLPGDAAPPVNVARDLHTVLAAALESADIASKIAAAEQENEENLPPIPAELAMELGRDGVQALWDHRSTYMGPGWTMEGSQDWYGLLPSLVGHTLIDKKIAYGEGKIDAFKEASEWDDEDLIGSSLYATLQRQNHLLEERVKQLQARVVELEGAALV